MTTDTKALNPFGPGVAYALVNQDALRVLACDATFDIKTRLLLWAWSGANRSGHAEFGQDELRLALTHANRTTGELRPPHGSTVSQAISALKARGALADESCSRCLVVPANQLAKRKVGTSTCGYHRLNRDDAAVH
jgi:hypothetical protein